MAYELSATATVELFEAYAHVTRDDPTAAASIIDRVRHSLELLGERPGMGRPLRERGIRRYNVPSSSYAIIYEVVGPDAIVLHVWHGSRRPPTSWRS